MKSIGSRCSNFLILFLVLASVMDLCLARSRLEDQPFFDYQVFFTNPQCQTYRYPQPVVANDGSLLMAKPKDVYCNPRFDLASNLVRIDSPHQQLVQLIRDPDVKELFLAFFSFSNEAIADELCGAIERNVALTLVIDSGAQDLPSARKLWDQIGQCMPRSVDNLPLHRPVTLLRGNRGGIGFGHNKLIIAEYVSQPQKVKIIFGSGNISSGTVLHHENWNFVTTHQKSYFAQVHLCLKEGVIHHGESSIDFKTFLERCRAQIETPPEEDLQSFFVPGEGAIAMQMLSEEIRQAQSIDGAAHRFSHPVLIQAMIQASQVDRKVIRFIVDDDIYWAGQSGHQVGSNSPEEFEHLSKVIGAGVRVRYMETNQNQKLLNHNKFLIFNRADGRGVVFTGAGNFTKAAFSKNFENFYLVSIPRVVSAFRKQYEQMFNQLSTPYEKLPSVYSNP